VDLHRNIFSCNSLPSLSPPFLRSVRGTPLAPPLWTLINHSHPTPTRYYNHVFALATCGGIQMLIPKKKKKKKRKKKEKKSHDHGGRLERFERFGLGRRRWHPPLQFTFPLRRTDILRQQMRRLRLSSRLGRVHLSACGMPMCVTLIAFILST
jgi:hypothetical protein